MQVDKDPVIEAISGLKHALDMHIELSKDRDKKVDQLYNYFFIGNGVPSMRSRIDRIEEQMPDRETWHDVKNWVSNERKVLWTLLAVIITQIVVLIFQAFR